MINADVPPTASADVSARRLGAREAAESDTDQLADDWWGEPVISAPVEWLKMLKAAGSGALVVLCRSWRRGMNSGSDIRADQAGDHVWVVTAPG
jgi:hypothetical protein